MNGPTFLNLDFFFYKIWLGLQWLWHLVLILFGLEDPSPNNSVAESVSQFIPFYIFLASLAAVIFLAIIIYGVVRIFEINKKEKEKYAYVFPETPRHAERPATRRWEFIERSIDSQNPSEWRLAIIEADAVLEELVSSMGAVGESLGEQMKNLDKSDMKTLNDAWEAHKVRNRITHEGSNFEISHHEARRVVDLYEKVFKEFNYI